MFNFIKKNKNVKIKNSRTAEKKDGCPMCRVSEHTIEQLKKPYQRENVKSVRG